MKDTFQDPNDKKVIIIGGGPAGLTAAYKLSKNGRKFVLLEKDQKVGGLSKTINYKNYLFDIGGHRFFTKINAVEEMWREVLGEDFLHCRRISRIYYKKKFFYYPLRPLNTLSGLGLRDSILIFLSYLYSHLFPYKKEDTFDKWISNRFGRRLYDTFFKTYTQKVWGMPCDEIGAEWASQRIKDLSLFNLIRNSFIKQNMNRDRQAVIKTLIDSFNYPRFGPGMMWEAVHNIIKNKGAQIYLGACVKEIFWDKDKKKINAVRTDFNGENILFHGTDFISSMPIRELIQKLRPSVPEEVLYAANNLNYRDFITVTLIINKNDLFPDNWIYIHDPDVKVGRVQNFKNWSRYMVPYAEKTCLGLEYFCFEGDELWNMSDDTLIELGKNELEKLGLGRSSDIEDGCVVRMPKAYPSYDLKYRSMLRIIRQFLSNIENLQLVGRNGMHRYNNQDHSMLTAMLAVENIEGANHNLWKVNDEPDYHEGHNNLSNNNHGETFSVRTETEKLIS